MDRGLVQKACEGDPEALGQVLTAVRPQVLAYCRNRLNTRWLGSETPQDVTQEVMLAICQGLGDYRVGDEPFEAWVYRITKNKCADAMRQYYRRREDAAEVDALPDAFLHDKATRPDEQMVLDASVDEVYAVLDKMGNQGTMLKMRGHDYAADEVGARLGMTANAVRVAQHRGLKHLKKMIGDR